MCDFTEKETEAMELESEPRVRAQKLIISPIHPSIFLQRISVMIESKS